MPLFCVRRLRLSKPYSPRMADTTLRVIGNLEFALYDLSYVFGRYRDDDTIERFIVGRKELENVRDSLLEAIRLLHEASEP